MANNLDEKMQARLDAWRKRNEPKTSPEKRSPRENNYVARGDYGDDMRDYEKKDAEAWQKELDSNPMYRGYL